MHQIGQLDQFKNKNWGEKYTSILKNNKYLYTNYT